MNLSPVLPGFGLSLKYFRLVLYIWDWVSYFKVPFIVSMVLVEIREYLKAGVYSETDM